MLTLRFVAIASFCLSTLALGGCQNTTSGGSVGADRSQLMLVSSEQLDHMAAQSYANLEAGSAMRPPALRGNPNLTPMLAPARTNHYAGPAENPPGQAVLPRQPGIDSGSRRSYSFLTTA
jgi:hypothetical protein